MQSAVRKSEDLPFVDRNGAAQQASGYVKYSGFYGPAGLMGILVMHKNFRKVHGSQDTVMSVVY
jgi:hypothetical protein